jgi:hypothetical protein
MFVTTTWVLTLIKPSMSDEKLEGSYPFNVNWVDNSKLF